MPPSPDFTRDRRGWFYRALAPDAACKVLETGNAFASNWFPDVVRRDLAEAGAAQAGTNAFDMVLLHESLGGCTTLRTAIETAHRLLRPGGVLAVATKNRLVSPRRIGPSSGRAPRATGWRLRTLMSGAGFEHVELYTVYPDADAPLQVVRTDRVSSREFFHAALRTRRRRRWSPMRVALAALTEINLMPYLQPDFVIVGKKC